MLERDSIASLEQLVVSDTMWAIVDSVKADDLHNLHVMVSALARMEGDVRKALNDFVMAQLLKEEDDA